MIWYITGTLSAAYIGGVIGWVLHHYRTKAKMDDIRRNGADYNMPTQRSMEMQLFEIKESVVSHADGHTSINKTPKVTGKGQVYFVNKFRGESCET